MAFTNVYFFLVVLLTIPFRSQSNNDLKCYVCELEGTEACDNPFDSSQVASAECNSLEYVSRVRQGDDEVENPKELVKTDRRFRGSPILNRIFHRNSTNEINFTYVCVKIEFYNNDDRSIVRTCQRAWNDVDDVCDYISQELDKSVNLKSCSVCGTDNCNTAHLFKANLMRLLFISIFFYSYLS